MIILSMGDSAAEATAGSSICLALELKEQIGYSKRLPGVLNILLLWLIRDVRSLSLSLSIEFFILSYLISISTRLKFE